MSKPMQELFREREIAQSFLTEFKNQIRDNRDLVDLFSLYNVPVEDFDYELDVVNSQRAAKGLEPLTPEDYQAFENYIQQEFLRYRDRMLADIEYPISLDPSRANKQCRDLYGNVIRVGDEVMILPGWEEYFDAARSFLEQKRRSSLSGKGKLKFGEKDIERDFPYGFTLSNTGDFLPFKDILIYEKIGDKAVPVIVMTIAKNDTGEWGLLIMEEIRRLGLSPYIDGLYEVVDKKSMNGLRMFLNEIVKLIREYKDEDFELRITVGDPGKYARQIGEDISPTMRFTYDPERKEVEDAEEEDVDFKDRDYLRELPTFLPSTDLGKAQDTKSLEFFNFLLGTWEGVGTIIDIISQGIPFPHGLFSGEENPSMIESEDTNTWVVVRMTYPSVQTIIVPCFNVVKRSEFDKMRKKLEELVPKRPDTYSIPKDIDTLLRLDMYETRESIIRSIWTKFKSATPSKYLDIESGDVIEVSDGTPNQQFSIVKEEDGNEYAIDKEELKRKNIVPIVEG